MVQLIKAARGRITTYHGEDIGRDQYTGAVGHVGIDIGHGEATAEDLKLLAPAAGWMTWATVGSYGRRAIIRHDDGSWSLIAHAAAWFFNGARVEQRQHIGTMGNSGTVYVHAHQEYHLASGAAVDPLAYMSATAGGNYTPIGGFLMALSDQQQQELYDAVAQMWGAFIGTPVARTEGAFSFRDDLVNNGTNTIASLKILNVLAGRPSLAIDLDALAAKLVAAGLTVKGTDPAVLAAKLDESLRDDFRAVADLIGAVPQAVRDEIIAPQ